jgi:hypothetical protein
MKWALTRCDSATAIGAGSGFRALFGKFRAIEKILS